MQRILSKQLFKCAKTEPGSTVARVRPAVNDRGTGGSCAQAESNPKVRTTSRSQLVNSENTTSPKYTPAIDIWSIGCIIAEVLSGKPLFPGKSVVHQLELITDLLGTPSADTISGVRNEKARKYLNDMRKKQPVTFTGKFSNADPLALRLLQRLLAFDPKDMPTAEEALADPYFQGLAKVEREPSCQPISKLEFEFERRRLTKEDIRELIFREILEYHPQMLKDYMAGNDGANFLYPCAIGHFRKQFAYLEENGGKSGPVIPPERKHVSLPRSTVNSSIIPPKMNHISIGYSKRLGDTKSWNMAEWMTALV